MEIAAYLAISLVSVRLIILLVWRLASRRHSLPCPVLLRLEFRGAERWWELD
jgi:hypothetical protein